MPGRPGWVLERVLGVGGFGEVWLARHARRESMFGAVKLCSAGDLDILRHEGGVIDSLMAAGSHPNVVPLRDDGLAEEPPWLMFEYVEGGTLADWILALGKASHETRLQQILRAIRQLAKTVGHFHRQNPPIIHRDLKPSNILFDRRRQKLRITDFGLGAMVATKAIDNEKNGTISRLSREVSFLSGSHTPLYASPQQRNGEPPDPRDDVHALGVIAFQMFTGHLDRGAGPHFLEELREVGVVEELIEILRACVAHRPGWRPADASVLSDQLAKLTPNKSQMIESPLSLPVKEMATPEKEVFLQNAAQTLSSNGDHQTAISQPLPASATQQSSVPQEASPQQNVAFVAALKAIRNYHNATTLEEKAKWKQAAERLHQIVVGDSRSVDWLRLAAEQGDVSAQSNFGLMLSEGRVIEKDETQAVEWDRKAAEQGNVLAQCNLGFMLETGRGVVKDETQAVEWYRKAAEQGNFLAQCNLGRLFATGRGVTKDEDEAVEWYCKAAVQGHSESQFQLGMVYAEGYGEKPHLELAALWFQKAADQGHSEAQFYLGWLHFEGWGGREKNAALAAEWFQKAANQGHDKAQAYLNHFIALEGPE
ncbi:serine/threonine-protein kinase [Zavarzinella formosa]|uniref:serine/threonine-protein kinase n=1 Tax=Zavarzinella formosa TaxID=360055 RepID=UPI00138ACDB5|nr:serine/threonine-protein kinase [Zavarzinella formosa]